MSKEKPKGEGTEVDADGLAVQRYRSMVLVVVPARDFGDECLRYARSSLYNVHIGTWSVSTHHEELIKGRLQDEFMVDGPLAGAAMESYSGVIFAGGEGALELAAKPDALRLAREAAKAGKLIGAWGHAAHVLAAAGIVKGRRLTGHPDSAAAVRAAGGKFTGRQLEVDGMLVTARDDAVGMRFGKALATIVGI
ncbi:MAG TPA: DJ-1/PfpI family protein [Planctomycetota bacterium]|nr:DJ-1/PfpI family protein [Planctomycetota bacterium]